MTLTGISAVRIPEGGVKSISVGGHVLWQKPERYTELAYIESTGTQYIDTGIIGRSDMEIYLDYEFVKLVSTTTILFGAHNTGKNARIYTGHSRGYFGYGRNTLNPNKQPVVHTRYDEYTKLCKGEQVFKVNDEEAYRVTDIEDVDTGLNTYLFALNLDGAVNYKCNAKIYSCKLILDGTLVRDFVPCRRNSDGAIGMYDRVSKEFFGNAGTGAFIAGDVA